MAESRSKPATNSIRNREDRGREESRAGGAYDEQPGGESGSGTLGAIPELMRRVLGLGFSGFFMTEEAFRKALGDTLPRDWADFAVDQSERTRKEFLERLSFEIGRALENVDLAAALTSLLEGRTLEVKAEIRLGEREPGGGDSRFDVSVRRGERGP